MKRIVLIDECFPLNTRNRRILDSLARHYRQSAQLEVITWDRNNEYIEDILNELIELKKDKKISYVESQSGFDGRILRKS